MTWTNTKIHESYSSADYNLLSTYTEKVYQAPGTGARSVNVEVYNSSDTSPMWIEFQIEDAALKVGVETVKRVRIPATATRSYYLPVLQDSDSVYVKILTYHDLSTADAQEMEVALVDGTYDGLRVHVDAID